MALVPILGRKSDQEEMGNFKKRAPPLNSSAEGAEARMEPGPCEQAMAPV